MLFRKKESDLLCLKKTRKGFFIHKSCKRNPFCKRTFPKNTSERIVSNVYYQRIIFEMPAKYKRPSTESMEKVSVCGTPVKDFVSKEAL